MSKNFNIKLAVILICIASVLIVSCGKKRQTFEDTDPNSKINISVFSMTPMRQPPPGNKIYKWVEENLNVTFTWDILVGNKDQKIGVMIAGGDYPDILHVDSKKFYEASALIPLDELIDKYAPRLKEHYAEAWERMKEDDGHVYTLPVWGVQTGIDHGNWYGGAAMWIQKQILKEFGYPTITTLDEYFDIIIKYKERYPTINGMPTIGFSILAHDWRTFNLINPPNFLAGFPNDGNGTIDPETHEYKIFLDKEISKRYLKKLNDMNAMGIIDRSCFVDTHDQYLAKVASGRVLGFHDQAWQFQNAERSLTNQGMHNRTYAPLPIVFDEKIRPRYRARTVPNIGQGIGISVNAKDPVRIIRFLDAQLDDEVQRIVGLYGIIGEDYQLNEEGLPYRTQLQRDQQEDEVWRLHNQANLWRSHGPKKEGSYENGWPTNIADFFHEREESMRAEDRELWLAYNMKSNNEMMDKDPPPNSVWFPAWNVELIDGSEAQIAWKRAEDIYRRHVPRIILAAPNQFERFWTEYVSDLGKAGLEKYEAYMQKAIDERIKKWSPKN
ncbi:MAG: extracellular solute-binding protein [Treponema sp.]|nr:extracellular solute-binding protein [Treponema sp.]